LVFVQDLIAEIEALRGNLSLCYMDYNSTSAALAAAQAALVSSQEEVANLTAHLYESQASLFRFEVSLGGSWVWYGVEHASRAVWSACKASPFPLDRYVVVVLMWW
jgi:hypothetical protein